MHGRRAARAAMVGEVLGDELHVGTRGRLAGLIQAVNEGAQAVRAENVRHAHQPLPIVKLNIVGNSSNRIGKDLGAGSRAAAVPAAALAIAID